MRSKFLRHAAVEIVAESGLRMLTAPHPVSRLLGQIM